MAIFILGCGSSPVVPTTNLSQPLAAVATESTLPPVISPPPSPSATPVELVRVIDGDTIVVRMPNGTEEHVRYIGVDTPETVHPEKPVEWLGREATEANRRLLARGPLLLERDVQERDQYGRLLVYAWVGEVSVNIELVRTGFAYVSTWPPNMRLAKVLVAAQKVARAAEVGLWSSGRTEGEQPASPPSTEGVE